MKYIYQCPDEGPQANKFCTNGNAQYVLIVGHRKCIFPEMPLWSKAHLLFVKIRIDEDPEQHEVVPLSPRREFCGHTDDFLMNQTLKLEHKHFLSKPFQRGL